jgi:hypothetical protein
MAVGRLGWFDFFGRLGGNRGRRRGRLVLRSQGGRDMSRFVLNLSSMLFERLGVFLRGFFSRQVRYVETVEPPQLDCYVLVDGAGMRLLFGHAQFRQPIQNLMGLDFQLPSQLVDANLFHR